MKQGDNFMTAWRFVNPRSFFSSSLFAKSQMLVSAYHVRPRFRPMVFFAANDTVLKTRCKSVMEAVKVANGSREQPVESRLTARHSRHIEVSSVHSIMTSNLPAIEYHIIDVNNDVSTPSSPERWFASER